uniref:Uncharacterized protein n=1 Tax=Elaeophora elaphi TaxID=1147741 RepID=A0A158Q8X0_9BILA
MHISYELKQHHRISQAKRSKRAMRSGANTVANLRSKRYQMLKAEGNTQFRTHPTIRARQNQAFSSISLNNAIKSTKPVLIEFCGRGKLEEREGGLHIIFKGVSTKKNLNIFQKSDL